MSNQNDEMTPQNDALNVILARLARLEEASIAKRYANLVLSDEELDDLPPQAQQALLDTLDYRRKYQLIRKADDGETMIKLMTPEDVLFTIESAGRTDCIDLVLATTPLQLSALMDLTCWRADQYSPDEALDWIGYMIQYDPERAIQRLPDLPREWLLLMMSHHIRVRRFDWSDDRREMDEDGLYTLDEYFHYELIDAENPRNERFTVFMQMFYKLDFELYRECMEALVWELPSTLEEESFRLHVERMLDLGYPEYHDALSLLAPLDPTAEKKAFDGRAEENKGPTQASRRMPTFYSRLAGEGAFLAAAFALLPPEKAETLTDELVGLGNRLLVIRTALANLEEAQAALELARGLLSLGLEYLADGDPQRGANALLRYSIQHLFRVGYSLTLILNHQALAFNSHQMKPRGPQVMSLVTSESKDVILALLPRPPLFHPILAGQSGEGPRPFASLNDLRLTAALLARLDLLFTLHFRLLAQPDEAVFGPQHPIDLEPLSPEGRFCKLFATLAAKAVLGQEVLYAPLNGEALGRLLPLAFRAHEEGGFALTDDYKNRVRAWMTLRLSQESAEFAAAAQAFAEQTLLVLNEQAAALKSLEASSAVALSRIWLLG